MCWNKNGYNDALAISEAVTRPQMRFVAITSPEQQDIQALHRLRERSVQIRTGLFNQIRGLVGEYGLACSGEAYCHGRDTSAALGVLPRQHSSCGKDHITGNK